MSRNKNSEENRPNSAKSSEIRVSWKLADSISVISIVNEFKLLSRLDDKSTKKSKIFEKISEELGNLEPPIVRTATQVKTHWKFLQSEFQKYKRIAAKSGEAAVYWHLYEEMMALIGDRPKAKFVEAGIDSPVPQTEIEFQNHDDDAYTFQCEDETNTENEPIGSGKTTKELGEVGSPISTSEAGSPFSTSEAGSPISTSSSAATKKRAATLLESLKPAAVKKSRSEKSMEILLSKHQETANSQQQNLLDAFKNFRDDEKSDRERELEGQRQWESQEAEKQRQWEKEMIQWRTAQTNAMLLQIASSFTQSISQLTTTSGAQVEVVQVNPEPTTLDESNN